MKLSDLNLNLNIVKDGDFENLIKIDETKFLEKSLIFSDNKISEKILKEKNISVVICSSSYIDYYNKFNIGIIESSTPKDLFFEIMNYLSGKTDFYYKKEKSIISKTARINKNVFIAETDVLIEDGVIIETGTVIKEGTNIGKNSYIGPNCTIGAESFSYFGKNKTKVKSSKKIIIGENVELLGGNIVEKGVHRDTYIGKNTKVAIGAIIEHDTIIEEENMICAGAVITGRVRIEKSCYIGPNSTIRNNIVLGERTIVSMGAVVTKSTEGHERVTGNFAIEHNRFLKSMKDSR